MIWFLLHNGMWNRGKPCGMRSAGDIAFLSGCHMDRID